LARSPSIASATDTFAVHRDERLCVGSRSKGPVPMAPLRTPVVGYVRVSTEQQADEA
jgi:hypothetical protein